MSKAEIVLWEPTMRVAFGFRDKWNRQVGLLVRCFERADGRVGFTAHAARDNMAYGSSVGVHDYLNKEGREKGLAKYIARADKSARARLTATKKIHPDDIASVQP